jgi:uncharacterized membrane protein YeaQ/YmgE (transglycosylase-associated protein family)
MEHSLMDFGGGVGAIGTLVIGALAGWIAEKTTHTNMGLIRNVITGLIGSVIGSMIANAAGINMSEFVSGWFWGNLIISVFGAIIFLLVLKLAFGRRSAA